MTSARDEILARLRRGGKRGTETRARGRLDAIARQVEPTGTGELWVRFAENVARLGDHAIPCDDVAAWVSAEAQRRGWTAVVADDDVRGAYGLQSVTCSADREGVFAADCGITFADVAAAETGSVAVRTAPGRHILTSLAPRVHVCVLPLDRLRPDLLDVIDIMAGDPAATWAWITGSSRTADIEGIIVRGVHGPREVVVLGAEAR